MKISYRWLQQWVPITLAPEDLVETLTLAGLEVDDWAPVAADLNGVVIGEIVSAEPHPDADRLKVCTVLGDSEPRTIVCGAPNAAVGLKVPFATIGTVLPGGLKIKPAKLRGIRSEGMLCSSPELGLGEDSSGLLVLPADAPTGAALSDFLGLDDHVLDIDLTPNRSDCLSVRGLAREVSALTGVALAPRESVTVAPTIEDRPAITLSAQGDCPRYIGRIIRGVNVHAETPIWMVEALRRSGIRSLGPIVDVTNFVLLELGQPMHAFDLDRLNGSIEVRRAREGERLELLDGREVGLDPDMLLITDQAGPLAIAGVMGGNPSAVSDDTRDILLESAWFDPRVIAGRARRLGLSTESSHRFERGVDPELQAEAMERATALILDIAGGSAGPLEEAVLPQSLPEQPWVSLRLDRVNRLLGIDLNAKTVKSILERLGMSVRDATGGFEVQAPTARRDIEIEADLIEEIARVYGYDRLPANAPSGQLAIGDCHEANLPEARLRAQIAARGFQEVITWSFVGENALTNLGLAEGVQPLANPLSRDLAVLRTSLLPGLVETASTNLRRQQTDFRLFEVGHCFRDLPDGFNEFQSLGLLMLGGANAEHFSGKSRPLDFFDLKGELEHLFRLNDNPGEFCFEKSQRTWLHPGQSADIRHNGRSIGWLGQLHPAIVDELGWRQTVFVAELQLEPLLQRRLPVHAPTSRFPSVRRDLSIEVAEHWSADSLRRTITEVLGDLLQDVVIFDEYRGAGLASASKSLSFGLILRHVSRTLTDEEVEEATARVLAAMKEKHDATLRG